MSDASTIRRCSLPACCALTGIGLVLLLNQPLPTAWPLEASISRLFGWLIRVEDTRWARGPWLSCGWVAAAVVSWKWRAPLVRTAQGHWLWLAGFVALLIALGLGIKVQARTFSMSLVAPLLVCGAGWALGGAVMRKFRFPLLLLWLLVLPSPWLVREYERAQWLSQHWLEKQIGWYPARHWEAILHRAFPLIPHPVHTVFATLMICWLIPGGLWWRVKAVLLLMGFVVASAEFLLNTGC